MIRRYLLLEPSAPASEQGGNVPVAPVAPAAATAPTTPNTFTPLTTRKPTEAELKHEFKIEPMPGDPSFVESFGLTQLPPQEKKAEPAKPPSSDLVAPTKPVAPIEKKEPAAPVQPEKKETTPAQPEKKEVVQQQSTEKKSFTDGPVVPGSKAEGVKHFDYSGYTEQEQIVLKNMSSQSREVVSKMMKEHKELSSLKGSEYLQNPNAYVLSPDYQKLQEDYQFATKEGMHWQFQLDKIKKGEEWQPITAWDKEGNPVLGAAIKPSGNDEERVRLAMGKCFQAASQVEQDAVKLRQGFADRIKQDSAGINALQAKNFGWVGKPELLDEKVGLANGQEKSIKQIKEDFLSAIPVYRRQTIEADVAANLFVSVQIYAQRIRELEAAKQVAEIKTEEVRRAEPTSELRPQTGGAGAVVGGVREFSLTGLPR